MSDSARVQRQRLEDEIEAKKDEYRQLLKKNRYGVGISWDVEGSEVDIDLQAVIVDSRGLIVDAVYYNNLVAMNGAVGHTGDEVSGTKDGIDECIWVSLKKLPQDVRLIIFVIAAYDYGCLLNARNGKVVVLEEALYGRMKEVPMESALADVDMICAFERKEDGWYVETISEHATSGSHFLDIIEPTIGNYIRRKIFGAPAVQIVSFVMEKGAVTDFPSTALKRLFVGIGAKLKVGKHSRKEVVDIDISAIFYTEKGVQLGMVSGDTDGAFGVMHTGDEIAGAKSRVDMDDEAIQVNLPEVPSKVRNIVLLLTVESGTFEHVASAYARVCDQSCKELARYDISGGEVMSGLVVGRLLRTTDQRWSFQATGKYFKQDEADTTIRDLFFKQLKAAKAAPKSKAKSAPATKAEVVDGNDTNAGKRLVDRNSRRRASLKGLVVPDDAGVDDVSEHFPGDDDRVVFARLCSHTPEDAEAKPDNTGGRPTHIERFRSKLRLTIEDNDAAEDDAKKVIGASSPQAETRLPNITEDESDIQDVNMQADEAAPSRVASTRGCALNRLYCSLCQLAEA